MCQPSLVNSRKTILEDPTRQGGTRRAAFAEIKRRLLGVTKEVGKLFASIDAIPEIISSNFAVNKVNYRWLIDERRQQEIDDEITRIVVRYFQTDSDRAPPWFWVNQYIERSYLSGTLAANERLKALVNAAGINVEDNVLFSANYVLNQPEYKDRLALLFGRDYEDFKGLASGYSATLRQVLTDTVAAGRSPRAAQQELKRVMGLTRVRAERIARSEINRANNVARTNRAQDVAEDLGLDVRVIHRSSLVPGRTRRSHAERHGTIYTTQEQNEWWTQGSNRINCLCGVLEVVIEDDGEPMDKATITRLKNQRAKFL